MTSKKSFKKTGCVRGKAGARFRWPTVRSKSAGRKTVCQRGLPGFFYQCPYYIIYVYYIIYIYYIYM